jgi:hypothetical protein
MADADRPVSDFRRWLCAATWLVGTFLISALCVADEFTATRIPGYLVYVTLLLSAVAVTLSVLAAPISTGYRILFVLVAVMLIPLQFLAIGILSLVFTGLDGTQ